MRPLFDNAGVWWYLPVKPWHNFLFRIYPRFREQMTRSTKEFTGRSRRVILA